MKRYLFFSAIIVAALALSGCRQSTQKPSETEQSQETPQQKDNKLLYPPAIDLGLSVKWGGCNLGAESSNDFGYYYAWAEIEPKAEYSAENYKWYKNVNGDLVLTKKNFGPEDDVAAAKLGNGWRMPTLEEFKELIEKCEWKWIKRDGVPGYKVISKTNGNSIFLPCAGFFYDDSNLGGTGGGYYWSFTPEGESNNADYLYFCDHDIDWNYMERESGMPIRPVREYNDEPKKDGSEEGLEILGEIALGLEKFAKEAVEKGWIDTTKKEEQKEIPAQKKEDETNPEPQEPNAWYAKDFSFTLNKYGYLNYMGSISRLADDDRSYLVTRIGNKAWIKTQRKGITTSVDVFEYSNGQTTRKTYKKGKLSYTSSPVSISLGKKLESYIAEGKDFQIAHKSFNISTKGAKESTFCGRPCWIANETIDTLVAGHKLHLVRTIYLDKQYGFAYKVQAKGNGPSGKIDMTPFEVTSFTDHPTSKDIPDPSKTESVLDGVKRQVLNAADQHN